MFKQRQTLFNSYWNTTMRIKRLHSISGITLALFIAINLFNHTLSFFGAEIHIEWMHVLRMFYRNRIVEPLLLIAMLLQMITGIKLLKAMRKNIISFFDKLQIWTGLYLVLFLIIHLCAVFGGRLILHLDTNLYFGVAGLNTFPLCLFFIPYYSLAMLSVFGHLAAIHHRKMRQRIYGLTPQNQAVGILIFASVLTLLIMYGLTNHFHGFTIPKEYEILIGK